MTLKMRNWKQLREQVARMENRFNMSMWLKLDREKESVAQAIDPKCGTVACLAGTAYLLQRYAQNPRSVISRPVKWEKIETITKAAREWLGLNELDANFVFMGGWCRTENRFISQERALKYLDRVIATGKVRVRL